MSSREPARAGFVTLLGAPNAGKSTLINRLVGSRVSIVTHKVQTTRTLIRGITNHNGSQIIFIDAPGIFKPRRKLDKTMVAAAWNSARDADLAALIIDCERGIDEDVKIILDSLKGIKSRKILLLNKIDAVPRDALLTLAARANDSIVFDQTFMISALKGDGCGDLLEYLGGAVPEGPWLYPEDQISDFPMRQLAAEITREKLFLRLHQELPYVSHVETEKWTARPKGGTLIEQVIYVEREGQKKIVIGKSGKTIRQISMAARKEISEAINGEVHLFLFVKVRENWSSDPERYRQIGLEFPR